MIWLTWRQLRAQIITAAAALAALAGALFWTHPALARLYNTSGVPTCGANTNCAALVTRFLDELPGITPLLYFICIGFMFAVPAIIGVFWGAPLIAREIEAHTGQAGLEPERYPHSLAGGQARSRRTGSHGHRRAAQPHGDLVVQPDRPGRDPASPARDQSLPARTRPVRRPRHHPDRLRRVRVRPRRSPPGY